MVEQNVEVNENDEVIGSRPRDDFYTGKYIHRSAYLILLNSKNEILIQRRASDKKWYPNLYTYAVAGTVEANESYEDEIKKEMKKGSGISIPVKYLFKYPFFDRSDKAFRAVFTGKIDELVKQDNNRMKWISADELKKDIEKHPEKYAPPFVEGMKKYFAEFYGAGK